MNRFDVEGSVMNSGYTAFRKELQPFDSDGMIIDCALFLSKELLSRNESGTLVFLTGDSACRSVFIQLH